MCLSLRHPVYYKRRTKCFFYFLYQRKHVRRKVLHFLRKPFQSKTIFPTCLFCFRVNSWSNFWMISEDILDSSEQSRFYKTISIHYRTWFGYSDNNSPVRNSKEIQYTKMNTCTEIDHNKINWEGLYMSHYFQFHP